MKADQGFHFLGDPLFLNKDWMNLVVGVDGLEAWLKKVRWAGVRDINIYISIPPPRSLQTCLTLFLSVQVNPIFACERRRGLFDDLLALFPQRVWRHSIDECCDRRIFREMVRLARLEKDRNDVLHGDDYDDYSASDEEGEMTKR